MEVIYENQDLFAINKSAKVATLASSKPKAKPSITQLLHLFRPHQAKVGPPNEMGIVHRLDNETSGILVVAKNTQSYNWLREIWNSKQVKKTYLAWVIGKLENNQTIDWPIAHHPSKKKKMMVCLTPELAQNHKARPAITRIIPQKIIQCEDKFFSLVRVNIQTGVRHQIRVHLANLGHPLCSDVLYQNSIKRKKDRIPKTRSLLHLNQIEILPKAEDRILIKCPLPKDMNF